jgi:hypothetical protein
MQQEIIVGKLVNKRGRVDLSRPVVDLDRTHSPREWKHTTISRVQMDDTIAGMGKVNLIYEACDGTFFVEAGEDTEDFFDADTEVFAFIKKEN